MPLDPTVGGASANTYATLDEYNAYQGARLFSAAALAAIDADKEAALLWSCRLLDALFQWRGSAVDAIQALAWPRKGLFTANGFSLSNTVIPVQLKNAQCEFAGHLISGDRTADDPDLKVMGSETTLTSVKAGPVALTFGGGQFSTLEAFDAFVRSQSAAFGYLSKAVPDAVRGLIPPGWYVQAQLKRKVIFSAL